MGDGAQVRANGRARELYRPWQPLFIAAGLFSMAAIGCGGSEICDVPHLVENQGRGVEVEDCGTLEVDLVVDREQELALEEARDCVVTAQNVQRSFSVIWSSQGFDSVLTQAYVGIAAEGDYEIFTYSHDHFWDPWVHRWPCGDLTARPDCSGSDSLRDDLCFDCVDRSEIEPFCREP